MIINVQKVTSIYRPQAQIVISYDSQTPNKNKPHHHKRLMWRSKILFFRFWVVYLAFKNIYREIMKTHTPTTARFVLS